MRNISDYGCTSNQNTHLVLIAFFFQKSCRFRDNVERIL